MKAKLFLLPCLFLLLFSACRKTYLTNGSSETASISLKDCLQRNYSGENVSLCLDEVVNDSRCPIAAVCVWQGVATVRFNMSIDDKPYTFVLATTKTGNVDTVTTVQRYKITLLNVLPYPGSSSNEKPSAEVRITRQ